MVEMSGSEPAPIVALGDSITWGYPHGPDSSWVRWAAEGYGVDVINLGVNGDTLEAMSRRLDGVLALQPLVCIIMGGTNDVALGRRAPQMATDLGIMVERLQAQGVVPIIGTPIPSQDLRMERELASFRHFINHLSGTRRLHVIPFHRLFLDADGVRIEAYFSDDSHPSLTGYAAMGKMVVDYDVLVRHG